MFNKFLGSLRLCLLAQKRRGQTYRELMLQCIFLSQMNPSSRMDHGALQGTGHGIFLAQDSHTETWAAATALIPMDPTRDGPQEGAWAQLRLKGLHWCIPNQGGESFSCPGPCHVWAAQVGHALNPGAGTGKAQGPGQGWFSGPTSPWHVASTSCRGFCSHGHHLTTPALPPAPCMPRLGCKQPRCLKPSPGIWCLSPEPGSCPQE